MFLVYILSIAVLFYATLIYYKLSFKRAMLMLLIAFLASSLVLAIATFDSRVNKDILYMILGALLYGLLALYVGFWAYAIAIIIALKLCKRFKTIYSYTLFGAILGVAIGAIWTLLFMAMDARFDSFFILFGTAVGAITLFIDGKIYKGGR